MNVLLVAMMAVSTGAAPAGHTLTPQGLGPVVIGMTVPQAELRLNAKLVVDSPGEGCTYARRADHGDPGVTYMVEAAKITRVDVKPAQGDQAFPRVTTSAGIGLGDPAAKVRRAYGAALKIEPHKYAEHGYYYEVDDPADGVGVIFEIIGGKVAQFRAGRYPSLGYVEGCS